MSFYIVPIVGAGTLASPFQPKYIRAALQPGMQAGMIDLNSTTAIVWVNATAAVDAVIGANADAIVIPPLDNTVNVTAVQNELENLNIPAQWVMAGMTYRQVLRIVCGMIQLFQRLQGLGTSVTLSQAVLNMQWGQLSAQTQANVTAAVNSLGLDGSGVTPTTTVRAILFNLGQQFATGNGITLGDL